MKTLLDVYNDSEHDSLFSFLEGRKEECYDAARRRKKDVTLKYEDDKLEEWWRYDMFVGKVVSHPELGLIEVRADEKRVMITWVIEEPTC